MIISLLLAPALFLCVTLIMLRRNTATYDYRIRLIDAISEQNQREFTAHIFAPWETRYELFNKVSYDDMANKPWKSLSSYYDIKRFCFDEDIERRFLIK